MAYTPLQFDEHTLPDLDEVVVSALEFFSETTLPHFDVTEFEHPLVLGSVNAAAVGHILFAATDARYADESTYKIALEQDTDTDAIIIISASGKKHAIEMVEAAKRTGLRTLLITNAEDSPAGALLLQEDVFVFPKIREPYTYNTSTYLGMLLGTSDESASDISDYITAEVAPSIPDTLAAYDAVCLIVPSEFAALSSMFRTKFDELFGPKLVGRVFTSEEVKHAKTVVSSETECFISFGEENIFFGSPEHRVHIPLPEYAGPAMMLMIGYFVIGQIQKQHPPYFKEHITSYTNQISEIFNQDITPVVE